MTTQKDNLKEKEIEEAEKKAEKLKVPFIDLTGRKIPVEVLKEIPEEAAIFYKFIPIVRRENILEVGMINPDDLKAKEALRFITRRSGLETKLFIISQVDFKNVLKQYRTLRGEVQKALKELEKELEAKEKKIKPIRGRVEEMAERVIAEAPITKIVAVILRHATEGRASDVHIEPVEDKVKVRFRVDGILYTSLLLPKEIHASVISRIKIISNLKIDETRVPQDGRFHTIIGGTKIDFRVSTLPTVMGEKVALRVLDPTIGLRKFPDLGLQGHNLELVEKAIKEPFGMILITGPTSCGKTTTLYAILNALNQEGVNIISLEDPAEYYITGINQSQIKPEIGYTFATGLRHILRQDPDIIMVGEIRDKETANLAIHAALTGHIFLSTLHTNDVLGVIPRLMDMDVESFLLPTTLNLAANQRLIRRLCSHCKKEITAPPRIAKIIEEELANLGPVQREAFTWEKPFKIYRADGCKFCGGRGTKGRIALFEMLIMTPQLEEIINQGLSETKLKEEAQRQGMITMRQDGIYKVLQGLISFEEMLRAVED